MPRSRLAALVLVGACALGAPPAGAAEPTVTTLTASEPVLGPIASAFDGFMWTPTALGLIGFSRTGAQSETIATFAGAPWSAATGGPDLRLWAGAQTAVLAVALLPTSLSSSFPVSGVGVSDIAPGPDDNVWFTVKDANRVGVVTPAGAVQTYPLLATAAEAGEPVAITTGGDGALWFTKRLLAGGVIGRIDPATAAVTAFTDGLPPNAAPSAITLGPDGNVWFSDAVADQVGRITPAGVITMFPAVKSSSLVAGPDGNLWLAGGSTLSTDGTFTPRSLPVDTLAVGPDGNVWGVRNGVVSLLGLGGQQFSNPTRMTVPDNASGTASLYPSPITVSGLQGTVTKVTARLNGVHHRFASDLQVMLVGPGGQSTVLMANATLRAGDTMASTPRHSLTGQSIAFTAGGREPARRITSGVFSPIDPPFALNFVAPAPAAPSGGLAQFAGTDPNGTWRVFVVDRKVAFGQRGAIAGGWSLDVETSPPAPPPPPPPPAAAASPPPGAVPGQAALRDTTPPSLRVTGVPKRATLKQLRRGLRVRITPSEPVRIRATLAIRTSRTGAFGSPLASRTQDLSAATTLRLVPRIARRPSRTFTAQVRLLAFDRSGNSSTTLRTITVRR